MACAAVVVTVAVPANAASAAGSGDRLLRPQSLQADAPATSSGTSSSSRRVIVKYTTSQAGSARMRSLSAQGLRVRRTLALTGAKVVDVPAGRTAAQVAADLRRDPAVEYAVPDVLRKPLEQADVPNDPYVTQQWGLLNQGQPLSSTAQAPTPLPGIDVDALGAWGVAAGSPSVTVAVIDQGVDITHPDLQGAIWTNPGEVPGNGVDDDRNGFVDDVHGWDFVRGTGAVDTTQDADAHGTHVAGIVGAVRDNGIGIAGLASGVRIMPLKFMSDEGGFDSAAIEAIAYARDMGAKVINASWGASLSDDDAASDPALRDAISQCGCVFVAAAGNGDANGKGLNTDLALNRVYPAAFALPNELSVAALDDRGRLATYSNYGGTVDIAAPGDAILSTLPHPCQMSDGTSTDQCYGWGSGTSMAAPNVSALAALIYSTSPSLTPAQVVSVIKSTALPLTTLTGKVRTGGMLDAGAALRQVVGSARTAERLSGSDRYGTAAAVAGRFLPGVPVAYVASGERFPDALAGAALAAAQHAPMLLTASSRVPTDTAEALTRLAPERIVVLGGTGAVSDAVVSRLGQFTDGQVERLQGNAQEGSDRYGTAAAVARTLNAGVGSVDTVYIASGQNFPDALAGAALAGANQEPVLLTTRDRLPKATQLRLSGFHPARIVVLGGPGAVSAAVEQQLSLYAPVERVGGSDRFITAAMVAELLPNATYTYVANGLAFPDALAGAALAGGQGAPVMLASPAGLPPVTVAALSRHQLDSVVVLGGSSAISTQTQRSLGRYFER